jgi:ligand-binding sensor domain-containing protein
MKYKIQTLLSCTLAVLLAQFAARGSEGPVLRLDNYSARVWGLREGLPQGRVQVVTQTDDGYLWIGTSGGLARFDGNRLISYKRENTPDFVDDSILSLFPAKAGFLWIGTNLILGRMGVSDRTQVANRRGQARDC